MDSIRVDLRVKLTFLRLMVWLIVLFSEVLSAESADNKRNWRYHPSFDCSPVKIMDTPVNTYFLVHQQVFDKLQSSYDFPSLTIFYQDNRDGQTEIRPLTDIASLSSLDIRTAEYSKSLNSLIIGYGSGSVDIVNAGGDVRTIYLDEIFDYPGENRIRRIVSSTGSKDILVCNDLGYVIIDGEECRVRSRVILGKPVDSLFGLGNKTILTTAGFLYISDTVFPENFDGYRYFPDLDSVLWAAPLDDRSFAVVKGVPGGNVELLSVVLKDDGTLECISLCQDQFTAKPDNESVVSRYEGNFIPNRDGYLFYSGSKVWQLSKAGDGWIVGSLPLDLPLSPIGSWDFATFWSYRDRGKFIKLKAPDNDGDPKWTDIGVAIRPKAPAVFISTKMDYSPRYGLLLINHGAEQLFTNMGVINPSLLSCWDGGEWNIHSYPYLASPPQKIVGDDNLLSLWNRYKNRYPVSDPTGISIDPVNPDIAVIPSTFGGVMFQNLKNPDEIPKRICSPTDPLAGMSGSMPVMPDQNWASFCSMSAPKFDADTTLWFTYLNLVGAGQKNEGTILLKYLTKEKRKKLYSIPIESLSDYDICGTISVPYYNAPNGFSAVLPFIHESSKDYVVADLQLWEKGMYIVNHNGTPDDTSDDEIKSVYGYVTCDGRKFDFTRNWAMIEDPVNGNAIVAHYNGLAAFHPSSTVTHDGYISGADISVLENGERILPSVCQVNNIIFDTFGRMWIATDSQGVICVSATRNRVEYRLTADKTPLPVDRVYGLGWNPQTNSLMISTHLGLVEFTPDIPENNTDINKVIIYPDRIMPDYHGDISFHNLPFNSSIIVRDKAGNAVVQFYPGSDTVLTWDLKDKSGNRIPAGTYMVEIEGYDHPLELIVLSPR